MSYDCLRSRGSVATSRQVPLPPATYVPAAIVNQCPLAQGSLLAASTPSRRSAAMRSARCIASMVLLAALALVAAPTLAAERGLPGKPPALDDAGWVSLQQAIATSIGQQARLAGDASVAGAEGEANDQFGASVALYGDTALVGASADDVGSNFDQGSAYIYTRSGMAWTQQAKLLAADGGASDFFGRSVALDGDTALIGAAAGEGGAVYVFTRSSGSWTQQAKLIAADDTAYSFGRSITVSGDTALIGAFNNDALGADFNRGSVYVFTRSGTTWAQEAKLVAADGARNHFFGASLDLSGETALVGAPFDNSLLGFRRGSAYVFTRVGGTWVQQAKIVPATGEPYDQFGASVALSGDTALIGSEGDDVGGNSDQGAAYVFTGSGPAWVQQARLLATDGGERDRFGAAVALVDGIAMVGAAGDTVGGAASRGSAYMYTRVGAAWTQQARLLAADGAADDTFGSVLAISGDSLLVGAPGDDLVANANQGSAYLYTRVGTTWTPQVKLATGDGAGFDSFGDSVAIFGDTALVGAPFDDIGASTDRGAAYIFIRTDATWTMQAKLLASDGQSGERFGSSVALHGDTALVGAPLKFIGSNYAQGAAYVFVRSSGAWRQQARLVAADGSQEDLLGGAVALDGDTALVAARGEYVDVNLNRGAVYVHTRIGGTWTQQAKLVAGDGSQFADYGWSVALSGDTALVGAPRSTIGANSVQGAAYVFARSNEAWTQHAKLVAGDGTQSDQFGSAVAIDGDEALVGAPADGTGSAYVFHRGASSWTERAKLVAGDATSFARFGDSVALADGFALVGASADGVAHVFVRNCGTWTRQAKLLAHDGSAPGNPGASVALSDGTALVGARSTAGLPPWGNPGEGAAYVFTGISFDGVFCSGFEPAEVPVTP